MKRVFVLVVCLALVLLSACADTYRCVCCGDHLSGDEVEQISYCSDKTLSGEPMTNECYLCKWCYRDAMDMLIENFNGSLLEEYLFEYLCDNFSGSSIEQFLKDSGYEITYIE